MVLCSFRSLLRAVLVFIFTCTVFCSNCAAGESEKKDFNGVVNKGINALDNQHSPDFAGRLALIHEGDVWVIEGGHKPLRLTGDGCNRSPAWSPDGKWLLYFKVDPVNRWADRAELWISRADGSKTYLIESDKRVEAARWSPMENKIDYLSVEPENKNRELKLVKITGNDPGDVITLTNSTEKVMDFCWLPDGTRLVYATAAEFVRDEKKHPIRVKDLPAIKAIPAEGGMAETIVSFNQKNNQKELAAGHGVFESSPVHYTGGFKFSPGGSHFSCFSYSHFASINADGVILNLISMQEKKPVALTCMLSYPGWVEWSPAGDYLAFIKGGGREALSNKSLAVVPVSCPETAVTLTPEGFVDRDPAWSPGGKLIAVSRSKSSPWKNKREERPGAMIWLVRPDGSGARCISSESLVHGSSDYFPWWTREGERLMWVRVQGERASIWQARPDGSGQGPVFNGLDIPLEYYGAYKWDEVMAWHPGVFEHPQNILREKVIRILRETNAFKNLQELYDGLSSAGERAGAIDVIGNAARGGWLKSTAREAAVNFLWEIARTEVVPFNRQKCLAVLYDLGEKKALEQLVQCVDRNGLAILKEKDGTVIINGIGWYLLKEINKSYPQSYLARGIKTYEEVRGKPYFELERREKQNGEWQVYSYGDEQYDPEREIPGWERFLAEFPSHSASDDAAYRLARCYEIEGRFVEALNMLYKTLFMPDGDMRYHAAGRLVYIMDARMTYEQLKNLPREKLEPSLDPMIEYTLVVKEIRRDNFKQAAAMLEEFIETHKNNDKALNSQNLSPFGYIFNLKKYNFWGGVENQLTQVKELAGLNQQWNETKNPSCLYELAAAIYHNQMLYYNHLWAGKRQFYNCAGYINFTARGRAPAEMATLAREMINYNHSLPYFQRVFQEPSSPPELKAKALYSTGLCYIGLEQWGQDAWFGFTPSEVRQKIVDVYKRFIKEFPDSSMADDALLALGAYTGEANYLQKIIEEYPEGNMIEKAKILREEMVSPYYGPGKHGSSVPYKILSAGEAVDLNSNFLIYENIPEEIKKWAAANARKPFAGSKSVGEWSYILVAAGEKPTAGYSVEIANICDDRQGKLRVKYRIAGPQTGRLAAQVVTHPYVLVRIPASRAEVEFIKESEK